MLLRPIPSALIRALMLVFSKTKLFKNNLDFCSNLRFADTENEILYLKFILNYWP